MRSPARPILFVHGEKDSYVPVDQAYMLYGLAGNPKFLWVVPRARHNQAVAVEPDLYAQRTLTFFNWFLDPARAEGGQDLLAFPSPPPERPIARPDEIAGDTSSARGAAGP